jgi:rhamnose utilization protein RhaD (predicted bifunctional aldolase and dehydrogenase)/NAD(P)-dependent dehydrogenase (short-subunit alcohol dehydrogenase family)
MSDWPIFTGNESPLEAISKLSQYYGRDIELVIAGGGNTSVKVGDRLFVKGSGHALAGIGPEGFVEMDRAQLEKLLTADFGPDRNIREEKFKEAVMSARMHPQKGQRPSVEVVLHHMMPRKFVVHTHSTVANMFTCCEQGQQLIAEALGVDAVWVADVDPGLILAQTMQAAMKEYTRKTGRDCPRAIILQNHGLVVCGDTPEEVRQQSDWVIGALRQRIERAPAGEVFGAVTQHDPTVARRLVGIIAPALRALLGDDEALKVVSFDDSPLVMALAGGALGADVALGGPLCPDQIVYCKAMPMWVEAGSDDTEAKIIEQLRSQIAAYRMRSGFAPQVVLVRGLGMFTAGDDIAAADTTRLVYSDAIKVMAGARRLGQLRYMPASQREFFENWEVEQYRRGIARAGSAAGRAAGRIALVTGAAQGFGLEIARDLAAQGAHVVLMDMNVEGVRQAGAELCAKHGAGRAMGLAVDVTAGQSVEEAVHQVVRQYGGFDLVISNAGVLKAGSVKTQSEADFDFVTSVNYKGYFVIVQKTAPVMALQHSARPGCWSDIIQINSKSGLEGSNRNSAYAGSKFGGIGLTQSFALELVEDGIKVNSICPGNFFEGPLWSDPDRGLFVQYLRSGKVPGAKKIEDVRRAYEAKVPMGRGCRTADVMKAVYYLMEQRYETGQAVPVTGGQVMLR